MENEKRIDSFTIGTPATGGCIKVYFDGADTSAKEKIILAKQLFYEFVEKAKMRKEI
jgi:hypothetical protein